MDDRNEAMAQANEEESIRKATQDLLKCMTRIGQLGGDLRMGYFGEQPRRTFRVKVIWQKSEKQMASIGFAWPAVLKKVAENQKDAERQ